MLVPLEVLLISVLLGMSTNIRSILVLLIFVIRLVNRWTKYYKSPLKFQSPNGMIKIIRKEVYSIGPVDGGRGHEHASRSSSWRWRTSSEKCSRGEDLNWPLIRKNLLRRYTTKSKIAQKEVYFLNSLFCLRAKNLVIAWVVLVVDT